MLILNRDWINSSIIFAFFNQLKTTKPFPLLEKALNTKYSGFIFKFDKSCMGFPLKFCVGLIADETTTGIGDEDSIIRKL